MMSRFHLGFLLILITSAALLVFWMNYVVVPPMTAQNEDLFNHPDYIVENFSGLQMNHETSVEHFFSAKKMWHYVDEEISYVEQPYFTSTEPAKPVLRIEAGKAELLGNGKNVYLSDNVTASRGMDDEDKIIMVTRFLHLIPDESIAKTDEAVTIKTQNATLDAVGLELNNRTGILHLLSRVKIVEY